MTLCPARLRALIALLAAACGIALAAPASGLAVGNPWTTPQNQFLNMAHQGGELEAPGNTLYAFKTALKDRGADAVEMDSYVTLDGKLVISHNATLNATTDFGTADAPEPFASAPPSKNHIWDWDLADLKKLDDAYWYSPGKGQYDHDPADPHPFRGVATGDVDPPAGYTANDFTIPTFEEVLAQLPPGTKINIDMKDQSGFTAKGVEAAHALAAILKAQPGGDNENVMVASFGSEEIEAFNADMPEHLSLSGSQDAIEGYVLVSPYEPFDPEIQAIQPPDKYELSGNEINAPEFIKAVMDSRGDDYAIHVWGADGTVEDDALFQRMVDAGVQGFFPQEPSKLAAFLCANHVPDATGTPRCTPPAPPLGPVGELGKLSSKKGKVKAGKKAKIHGSISNGGDQAMTNVRACADIPKKHRKELKAKCVTVGEVAPGATADFTITVKTKKKAKGKYKLAVAVTSDNGGMQTGTAKFKVKKARRK